MLQIAVSTCEEEDILSLDRKGIHYADHGILYVMVRHQTDDNDSAGQYRDTDSLDSSIMSLKCIVSQDRMPAWQCSSPEARGFDADVAGLSLYWSWC
jgi:hypothetical protein